MLAAKAARGSQCSTWACLAGSPLPQHGCGLRDAAYTEALLSYGAGGHRRVANAECTAPGRQICWPSL